MGIQLMFLAAICIALSNLCMRRSIDGGGGSRAYLSVQLLLTCILMIFLHPVRMGNYYLDGSIALFSLCGGVFLGGIMMFLGKALESGPAGLSVSMINCSSVMPILFLVMLFGEPFGFGYTFANGVGSILVLVGMCWAGWSSKGGEKEKNWLMFIALACLANIGYLVFLHWRALFLHFSGVAGLGFQLTEEAASSAWSTPLIFLSAALIQIAYFFYRDKRAPTRLELWYGLIGSVANGLGSFFMIWATEVATSIEQAMLFPVLSVTVIIGCSIWGRWLYAEPIHWRANALCIGGLLIGTVDWHSLIQRG